MTIANIHDAKAHLSQLIQQALAGEEVVIARAGHPLVRLVPVQWSQAPRQGGQWKDRISLSDDFDAYSPDVAALFEGKDV